ncbi:MAG: pyrroline-5-carboxylate reductase [Clostridiales bacterium]|nr:pyrroline-5-carboxylate reductase [Clostridiales bacterium]
MNIAVIGTGNMGRALAKGFANGFGDEVSLYLFDVNQDASIKAAEELGGKACYDVKSAVENADYVLIAVKPVNFDEVLAGFKSYLKPDAVVLSIAAAVTVDRIRLILGEGKPFVRIMPNTPAQVGCGVSAVCPVGLTEAQTNTVIKLFETCGEVIVCKEKTLDNIGCVSGTGPAYVMLFIEAMADAACALGIKRDDAIKIAAATVMGSGKLCLESGEHPAVLKDRVCSPGGTTIAGVKALEENGLRNAVIKAVDAAAERTKQMKSGN